MKTTKITFLALLLLFGGVQSLFAQGRQEDGLPDRNKQLCTTHEAMEAYYEANPQAKAEHEALEKFTQEYAQAHPVTDNLGKPTAAKYRIPVVFHVYGGPTHTFWGKTVTKAIVVGALADLNKDFQGLNDDYGTVNSTFASVKSTLDISFEFALKKPDGTATDGIDWKTTTGAGYGNGSGYDSKIAADAWDNTKYMNIYIVADLYNDGQSTNSGVCWYPDVSMTTAKTARLVYNGQYLGNNTTKEFRSVFTHEVGHFLNLAHTFDTGCSGTGDGVSDTPLHKSTSLGCPTSQTSKTPTSDCGNWQVNVENYMDYNGAFDCQKMFTKGQVTRMIAALELNNNTRRPLWQQSNLIFTGILNPTGINSDDDFANSIRVYPNPSNGIFQLEMMLNNQGNSKIEVIDLLGCVVYSKSISNVTGEFKTTIDLNDQSKGIYFVSISNESSRKTIKLINE